MKHHVAHEQIDRSVELQIGIVFEQAGDVGKILLSYDLACFVEHVLRIVHRKDMVKLCG